MEVDVQESPPPHLHLLSVLGRGEKEGANPEQKLVLVSVHRGIWTWGIHSCSPFMDKVND